METQKGDLTDSYQPSSHLDIMPKGNVRSLPIDVSILVPSTRYDRRVSRKEFSKRVHETSRFMAKAFGGDTTILAHGGYISGSGKEITEDVANVNASMTQSQFEDNKHKLALFIKEKLKEWKQETIAYKVENDLKIYPKRLKRVI